MGLDRYRSMRDPERTPEPVPAADDGEAGPVDHTGPDQAGRGDTFVVQEHHATALHWDFRLERDGVLVSWAVPKGLPLDPHANRLAKQTEDHPLAYATFGGDIPDGEYGGGRVTVWDTGTYELETWTEREVKVVLHGHRVEGRYVLFRTRRSDWMVHRMDPPPAGWTPLPSDLCPMLAVDGPLPDGPGWSYEVDWAGLRVLVAVDGGRLVVTTEAGDVVTGSWPELRPMGLQLGSRQVLLDAALVVLDAGRPDPRLLADRVASAKPGRVLLREAPVQLMAGDLLHLEGRSMLDLPARERRAALEQLGLAGPHWQVPPAFDDGPALLAAARGQGLAGVLSKRQDSGYDPGVRSRQWVSTPA